MNTRVALIWRVAKKKKHKDLIPGGLADKKDPSDFYAGALAKGIKVELEHTSDKDVAREIAMDHLTEDKDYYDKLETIEKHAKVHAPIRGIDKGLKAFWSSFLKMLQKETRNVESHVHVLQGDDVSSALYDRGLGAINPLPAMQAYLREVRGWWREGWPEHLLVDALVKDFERMPNPWAGARENGMRKFVAEILSGRFAQYVEEEELGWNEKWQEGVSSEDLDSLRALATAVMHVGDGCATAKKRLEATRGTELQRDGGKLEKLYHASINAKALFQNGFDKVIPDQAGLGGSQEAASGKGTSFTYDRFIAKEIVRGLREMAMVANGSLDAAKVVRMINNDKAAEAVSHLVSMPSGYRAVVEDGRLKFLDRAGHPVDPRDALPKPENVAWLYKAYLASQRGKRYDPFFMYPDRLIAKLKGVNPSSIGYVEATVDMSHPGILHNKAEREVRVPPEAIVSTDRLVTSASKTARQDQVLLREATKLYEKLVRKVEDGEIRSRLGKSFVQVGGLFFLFQPGRDTYQMGDKVMVGLGRRALTWDTLRDPKIKSSLVHEITHILDKDRIGQEGWSSGGASYKSPEQDVEAYSNHPFELNAYFMEALLSVSEPVDQALADLESGRDTESALLSFWDFLDLSFVSFARKALRALPRNVAMSLTEENKRRMKKRLYQWWSDKKAEVRARIQVEAEKGGEFSELAQMLLG